MGKDMQDRLGETIKGPRASGALCLRDVCVSILIKEFGIDDRSGTIESPTWGNLNDWR